MKKWVDYLKFGNPRTFNQHGDQYILYEKGGLYLCCLSDIAVLG